MIYLFEYTPGALLRGMTHVNLGRHWQTAGAAGGMADVAGGAVGAASGADAAAHPSSSKISTMLEGEAGGGGAAGPTAASVTSKGVSELWARFHKAVTYLVPLAASLCSPISTHNALDQRITRYALH